MDLRAAILGAGALIAIAVLFTNHWRIAVAPAQIYRLDRWAGTVTVCNAPSGGNGNMALVDPGADIPCKNK
jgi:hypothetical protein